MKIPLLRPNPPRLSQLGPELEAIEASGVFSNYGPVNSRLEEAFISRMFGGNGACTTVCNATIGLMLALRQVLPENLGERRYALMPSFSFAAAAQAVLWTGLIPLYCDIDEKTWMMSHEEANALLEAHRDKIAVIFPYATFGNCLDLEFYQELSAREGIPLVVDAAASLGSRTAAGLGFGTGCAASIVFSMHVTKTFAVAEAGLIYCANTERIRNLKAMANFGFGTPRICEGPGLNGKLSEVTALMALTKLEELDGVIAHREALAQRYRKLLPSFATQSITGSRHPYQFMSLLLPEPLAPRRHELLASLSENEIGSATYFSPHLAEHPYLKDKCLAGPLDVTAKIARRIVSLPMSDRMTIEEVETVCEFVATSLAGR